MLAFNASAGVGCSVHEFMVALKKVKSTSSQPNKASKNLFDLQDLQIYSTLSDLSHSLSLSLTVGLLNLLPAVYV